MAKRRQGKKGRRLWLKIRATVPGGIGRAAFWGTLKQSIVRGDYELPDDWKVTLEWRNREDSPMRQADFSTAMLESAESSRGWDKAIQSYIQAQIDRLPEAESVPAITAVMTKRLRFEARSRAAVKGWVTRRKSARRRSAAARKGWRTRRGR